jgi:signal transduction histidine kinase
LPPPLRNFIDESLNSGLSQTESKLKLAPGPGGDILLHASLVAAKPTARAHAGATVVLNDISSASNWELNLRRLDRLHSIGALSASMDHEVKNAFVAVRTFVDLLLEQNKQSDLAEVVRAEMGRIDTILTQMRRLSGPARPRFSEVRLHSVVDKSLVLIQHLLEEKRIKLTRSFRASDDLLRGDPDQLEQALINLFFNAFEAMQPDGQLTVSTETMPPGAASEFLPKAGKTPSLRLTIQDNGGGIAPEHMDRLFEPFFTTKAEGTGLGLAITRRIALEHQGAITVKSKLQEGTTFSLIFPCPVSE